MQYGLSVQRLQKQCRLLYLSLDLPPAPQAPVGAVVGALLRGLHLPAVLGPPALRLMSLYGPDTRGVFKPHKLGQKMHSAESTCMAAIFVVLKLLYVLDGICE